ncbi:hypothetical protein AYI69_g2893 [Smittium culicis]|uniref:Uncharacterized protein n=1 Tax=Smittium culicis TaxID=133412 RepID=A0A1R1YLA6_9FUNG|nr:hypothetical protein AYI69_g2893 [Smittium culicis]
MYYNEGKIRDNSVVDQNILSWFSDLKTKKWLYGRENNHTVRENNHTVRENNHTVRENNHTVRENNHTVRENNHTVRENNHTQGKLF